MRHDAKQVTAKTRQLFRNIGLLTLFVTLAVAVWTPCTHAAQKGKKPEPAAFLTPEAAGPDYEVQGEYVGTVGHKKIGIQVIALGHGTFQAVVYAGGLPGAGWNGDTRQTVDGKTQGDRTVFAPSKAQKKYMGNAPEEFSALTSPPATGQADYHLTLEHHVIMGTDPSGHTLSAGKIVRTSPTLGARPPAGALILFDGTNTDQWNKAKVDERSLLFCNTETKKTFGSFTMHVEFCTPFRPTARSQGRGNSGIYIQRRYEVQVLDSFGLAGEKNECGGLYRQVRPSVNMALPPLMWQTYDIDFTAATFDGDKKAANAVITVRHNGVVIHDAQTLVNKTGAGRKEGPNPGPIWLQGHGNPVFYRNIWLVEKP